MIQLRLVLFGVSVIAGIGYAIYNHYQKQQPQQHSYGPREGTRSERPPNDEYTAPPQRPASSNSSRTSQTRRRRRADPTATSTCSICLVNVAESAPNTRSLSCGHFFHAPCIEVWFNTNKTCPNCRARV